MKFGGIDVSKKLSYHSVLQINICINVFLLIVGNRMQCFSSGPIHITITSSLYASMSNWQP